MLATIAAPCSLIRGRQRGAAAVEFALVAVVFFTLLLGVVEWSRVIFTWNSVAEATRYGARVAAVCDLDDVAIVERMQRIVPRLAATNVRVVYEPGGCSKASCRAVAVAVDNLTLQPAIPFWNGLLQVPGFETRLVRESLESVNSASERNPVCFPGDPAPTFPPPAAL